MPTQQRRSSAKRLKSKHSSFTKTNNVLVFKLIDPICQSLLFIYFIYSLDSNTYQSVLQYLIALQVLSCIVNFILHPPEQLKGLRIAYLVAMAAYIGIFYLIEHRIPEENITVRLGSTITIPLYDSIYEIGALAISFWYYTICFREIRDMLTSVNNGT